MADDKLRDQIAALAREVFQREFAAETTLITDWLKTQAPLDPKPVDDQKICPVCNAKGGDPCVEERPSPIYPHDLQISICADPHPERHVRSWRNNTQPLPAVVIRDGDITSDDDKPQSAWMSSRRPDEESPDEENPDEVASDWRKET
jgi:hypothetical protein